MRTSALVEKFLLFPTEFGHAALIWSDAGLKGTAFPRESVQELRREISSRHPQAKESRQPLPKWVKDLRARLQAEISGQVAKKGEIGHERLDLRGIPDFHARVYREAMRIPRGRALSYGELATLAGSPGAARAVGQAMAKNPFPLVVPCHRVLSAGGKIGGFTAPGGLQTKRRLLECEGFEFRPRTLTRNFDADAAIAHLSDRDPKLARLIRKVGGFEMRATTRNSPYEWLLRSIIYQQLHGKAAATIHARVRALFDDVDPTPEQVLAISPERLAACGLSRNKLAAIRDLARHTVDGHVPDRRQMSRMSDEEIVNSLLPIRGVGRWTIEMLLIFGLGRADVLAVDDFALRKSAMILYGLKEMPNRQAFLELGEKWRPWRTVASWYLWRQLDLGVDAQDAQW